MYNNIIMRETKSLRKTGNLVNPNSWLFSSRNDCSQTEDPELDTNKGFKLLFHCFNHNHYRFVKQHKNCLGDVEEVYRPKIPREDQLLLEECKDKIFSKHSDKLKKEMHNRNNFIQRAINQYQSSFKQLYQLSSQNLLQDSDGKTILQDALRQTAPSKILHRPLSSHVRSRQLSTGCSVNRNLRPFSINSYNEGNIQFYKSTNIETAGTYIYQKQKRNRRGQSQEGPRSDQRPKSFYAQNEQIFIQEKHTENFFDMTKSQTRNSFKEFTPNYYPKSCRKQQQMRLNYRKILEQKEKQQIKSKIFLVNSALVVNLARPQGYKPKSQCWQKYCL